MGAMITPLITKLTSLGVQTDATLRLGMYVTEGPMPLVGRKAEVTLEPAEIVTILSELLTDPNMCRAVHAMVDEMHLIEREAEGQTGYEKSRTLDRLRMAGQLRAAGADALK